jgi:hypothetical protein
VTQPAKKGIAGGLAITGKTASKGLVEIMNVTPDYTQILIDETATGGDSKSGFSISGRSNSKASGMYDIFTVQPERTEIYVKNNPMKAGIPGFSIFGLDNEFNSGELFSVTEQGALVNGTMAVPPKVTTGLTESYSQTEASVSGSVTDDGGSAITQVGVIYNMTGLLNTQMDLSNSMVAGMQTTDPAFADSYTVSLMGLAPGTTYQVRTFAMNADGATGYGDIKTVTTQPGYEVTFSVYTESDSTAINDAVITVSDAYYGTSFTNPPGDYVFNLAAGYYDIEVVADGYFYDGEVGVEYDEQPIDVYLPVAPPKVTFNLVDELGNPVPNVDVVFALQFDEVSYMKTTDASGMAVFHLYSGDWDYFVTPEEDYTGSNGTVTIESQDVTITDTVYPIQYYTVSYTVTDQFDNVLIGWTVELDGSGQALPKEKGSSTGYMNALETDGNGFVQFTDVPGGLYNVRIRDGQVPFEEFTLDLTQDVNETVKVNIAKKVEK